MSRYTEYMKEKVRCKYCCEHFSRHYYTYKHIDQCDQIPHHQAPKPYAQSQTSQPR